MRDKANVLDTNPENQYAIDRRMKVRSLEGVYIIMDSWMIGKHRRYKLRAEPGSGARLKITESFGSDMQPAPEPETAPQEPASPAGHAEPAPVAEHAAPDAISGPEPATGYPFTLDAGSFGGELDPYSPGAQASPGAGSDPSYGPALDGPGELSTPCKLVRRLPQLISYSELGSIQYHARLKGFENHTAEQIDTLEKGTPIAIILTQEANGHAIWIVISNYPGEPHAALETYYPEAQGSSADALEYAVLLALRQIPIRTEDLEINLLSLSS